jgi:hypothetical protein
VTMPEFFAVTDFAALETKLQTVDLPSFYNLDYVQHVHRMQTHDYVTVQMPMRPLTELICATQAAVAATDFEKHMLIAEPDHVHTEWHQLGYGYTVRVGLIGEQPVVLYLSWATVDGRFIVFYNAISRISDKFMIDDWVRSTFVAADTFTDAMNFSHAVPIHNLPMPMSTARSEQLAKSVHAQVRASLHDPHWKSGK